MTQAVAGPLVAFALATFAAVAHAQSVEQAQALIDARDYATAARVLEQRLRAEPDDAQARFLLARTHAWNGEPERALPLYESLLSTEPDNADYLLGYGQALSWSGRHDQAVGVLERAQRMAPAYADIGAALAQARAAQAAAAAPPPAPTMAAPSDAPAPAMAEAAQRRRAIVLSARHDGLDSGYDDWSNLRLDLSSTQRGEFGSRLLQPLDLLFGRAHERRLGDCDRQLIASGVRLDQLA